ncbi:MAG: isochorismatase family protein [Pseudomonadota bacterium]
MLLLIDVQQRLSAAMPEQARRQVLRNGAILAAAAAVLGVPVLYSEQYPKGLGATEPELAQALPTAAQRFEKTCFSCGGAQGFMQALETQRRDQIILAGMETHVCVLQTALELRGAGRQVFVVEDAVCSRQLLHHQNALARLRAAGVIVSNVESVVFEWLGDAGHEHFKKISALIK